MNDKEAQEIFIMSNTLGWQYLIDFINTQKNVLIRQLTCLKFTSIDQIARIQGEIAGYEKIIEHVNNCRKKIMEG